jgi:hypothetical protein
MALTVNQLTYAQRPFIDPGFLVPGNMGNPTTVSADLTSPASILSYLSANGVSDADLLNMTYNDMVYAVRVKQSLTSDQSGVTTFSDPE